MMDSGMVYGAIYEAALAHSAGVAIMDVCDALKHGYADVPEVAGLFQALQDDWYDVHGAEDKLVAPFAQFAKEQGDDFLLLPEYAKLGSWATMIDVFWTEACAAYLLRRRLANHAPVEADIVLGQSLMTNFPPGAKTYRTYIRGWSADVQWQEQIEEGEEALADFEAWAMRFPATEAMKLRSRGVIVSVLESCGALDSLAAIERRWQLYCNALQAA